MSDQLSIDRLSISAFRGVTAPLELDLTSPITLVFAPNGTGKTTFCEAAEWLLTGQVERLKDGGWSNEAVRSLFDDGQPVVEGQVSIGGKSHRLRRTVEGAWLDDFTGSPEKVGDLLELLAPAAAAPDRHHKTAISLRQHYLRGTRFLMGEALAALVDNDAGSLDRRKDVFADLLGIRHLRDAEQDSEKYAEALNGPLALLNQGRTERRDEAARLRQAIANASADSQSALSELEAGERLLGLSPDSPDIDPRLQALASACAGRRHTEEAKDLALVELGPSWDRRPELETRLAELKASEVQTVIEADEIQTRRSQAEGAASTEKAAVEAAEKRIQQAREAAAALIPLVEKVASTARLADPYLHQAEQTLASLVIAAPEADWSETSRQAARGDISFARASETRLQQNLDEERRLIQVLNEATALLPEPSTIETLRVAAESADEQVERAKRDAEVLGGPLGSLQALGRQILTHRHDDSDCPLCGQDWDSHERLKEAIDRTLAAAPALVSAARERVTEALGDASAKRELYDKARAARNHTVALGEELARIRTQLDRDRAVFGRLNIPIDPELRSAGLEWSGLRLDLAQALADLSEARRIHRAALVGEGAEILGAATRVSDLLSHLTGIRDARLRELAAESAALVVKSDQATADVTAIMLEEQASQSRLAALRRDIADVLDELSGILRLWTAAAGDVAWTAEGLEALRLNVQSELRVIGEAEGRLAAARAGWDVELRRSRLRDVEAELIPLDAKYERLTSKRAMAITLRDTFRENYIKTSTSQVSGLSRVVNALFLRMHANKIVEKIDLGSAEAFLKWLADAGEAQLDPGRDFSQGQKQDLALSLFLARARGLGGTFFLDEPVSHLDDLNRVGLMDVFRSVAVEGGGRVRLVITTASRSLARHMVEKFGSVSSDTATPILRVLELSGNGRFGVRRLQAYPMQS